MFFSLQSAVCHGSGGAILDFEVSVLDSAVTQTCPYLFREYELFKVCAWPLLLNNQLKHGKNSSNRGHILLMNSSLINIMDFVSNHGYVVSKLGCFRARVLGLGMRFNLNAAKIFGSTALPRAL